MTNYFLPLQYDTFYHVYNRGNNGEKIFFNEENYRYFLRKFGIYLTPYIEVYAYCLLPNHFHFLIKTKRKDEMEEPFMQIQTGRKLLLDYTRILSEIFRRFFSAMPSPSNYRKAEPEVCLKKILSAKK